MFHMLSAGNIGQPPMGPETIAESLCFSNGAAFTGVIAVN
jgi:hypothetical protein